MIPSTVTRHLPAVLLAAAPLLLASPAAASEAASETARLLEALAIRPGDRVADVGAGNGAWTERIARRVGPGGHVWATEVEDDKVEGIADRVERAGLGNVTVLRGDQGDTGLPESCCDAVLLRLVYHHFQDPAPMRASLKRALRPGGRLVIVDVPPQKGWRKLDGVPDRGGHGIPVEDLVREVAADGFELLERYDDWDVGEAEYCVVFRRPEGGS